MCYDWSVRAHYSTIKHIPYVTPVFYLDKINAYGLHHEFEHGYFHVHIKKEKVNLLLMYCEVSRTPKKFKKHLKSPALLL